MAESFDERLDQLDRALRVVKTVESNPELQTRALDWLLGGVPAAAAHAPAPHPPTNETPAGGGLNEKSKRARSSGSSKATSFTQDKTLEIAPKGKTPWADFVAAKSPQNNDEKNTAAVYWLLEEAGRATAGISQMVTLFIAAKWVLPRDPKNSAQTAGSHGLLDTSNADDIKLTSQGIALVINGMPRPAKK
ncbi:MAG: hypothetical protein L6367_05680 [Cellulomonas sp.]|nr:hypothetical protein [Cellulomonas sp.]